MFQLNYIHFQPTLNPQMGGKYNIIVFFLTDCIHTDYFHTYLESGVLRTSLLITIYYDYQSTTTV